MKMWKKIFTAVLAVGLMMVPAISSSAAEPYTYTVTFSAGNHGMFEKGEGESAELVDKLVHTELPAGSTVSFTAQTAVKMAENSKYYVKGVRLSGRDNSEAEMATLTVTVDKDLDYVVVYGIKGNQVNYTVNYEDTKGNKLAESDVFYGNVGDKPVVAYKYIEGYAPQVLAFTKTLSENAAENIFTFVYGKAAEGNSETIYVGGGTTIVYDDVIVRLPGGGTGTGTGTAGQGNTGGEDADAEGQGAAEGEGTPETPAEPQEIVDLDDEETPLGNIDVEETKEGLSMAGMLALMAVCIAALVVLIVLLIRLKKRGKKEEEENN